MSVAGGIETRIQEHMEWNLVEEYKEVSHRSAGIGTRIQEYMEWNLVEEYKEVSHRSAVIYFLKLFSN